MIKLPELGLYEWQRLPKIVLYKWQNQRIAPLSTLIDIDYFSIIYRLFFFRHGTRCAGEVAAQANNGCLLYTSPSPRD